MITLHLNDQVIKSLSGPELAILKYAYEHTGEVLEMSIQQLSEKVAYSSATVLRFCKKLGYSGFAEFKYALRAEVREKREQVSTRSGREFASGMTVDTLDSNVQATSKLVREEELLRAFRYLDSGCPVYLWSPGGLTSVAVEYFEKLLLSIGRQEVYFIESVKMFEHILHSRAQESLLVLISTSGTYATTVRLGKIARMNGIPILSITPYTANEVAGLADVNFRFFTDQREHLGAEFTSRLPIFFVINSIIQCYLQYREGKEFPRASGQGKDGGSASVPLLEKARLLDLTETEKEILACFEANPAAVTRQTLGELCGKLFTSNATIVRFCQKLGLSGYNDFKYQLRSELRQCRQPAFYTDEYISREVARFQDTIAALDVRQLEEITALLTSGRPLYIYGTNLSALPARYLQIVLNSLDYPSILIEWKALLNGLVQNMNDDAILLLISAKGQAENYLQAFQAAKRRGLTTILLTCERDSLLIPYSAITVCTNDQNEEFNHTDINPRLGIFTVIQILIELTAKKMQEKRAP